MRALASHQCGPGSNPGIDAICGLSLLLVLSFALRGFTLGTPVFPSPQKPTFPNSHSTRNQIDEEPLCGCATSKSLFIYFIYAQILVSYWAPRHRGIKQKKLNHHEAKPWINNIFLLIYSHRPDGAKNEFQYNIEIGLFPSILIISNTELVISASVLANSAWLLTSKLALFESP